MKFDKKDKIEIFENAISLIIVFAMFVYGAAKTIQFGESVEIGKTVSEMTGMELMWTFYSYSKNYALTLGLLEIIGGVLILIKRTRIIGCLFISTILINVILQDIYFGVHIEALKAAVLYQFLVVIILWINREKLTESIKILIRSDKSNQAKTKQFIKLSIAFFLFLILRVVEYFITIKM